MAKSPPKRIGDQSNKRASNHLHAKVERPKKPPQQSAQNMKATKFKSIMEKLGESDGNGHGCNININHFVPLFESDYYEGINPRKKSKKTPVILLSKYE